VLKVDHEGGCHSNPTNKSSLPAATGPPDKCTLQYAKALMTAMDLSGQKEPVEDEEVRQEGVRSLLVAGGITYHS
jgi:hypothetical protein